MANISSNGTGGGDSNVGASWAGGIVPVEGDKVTVVLADTITLVGTHIWGDDTATAVTVNGTLKASRSSNSQLTIKGGLTTAAATTSTIDFGRKSTSDRIPAGVTATLILNYSAAMVNYKYGLSILDTSNFYAAGQAKTRNASTTSALSAGGTSVDVDDITGWLVGDKIILAETDGTWNHSDEKTISTITPGSGTTGTVTFSAVTYAHASGCPIGNFSSNVTIKNYNTTNPAYVYFRNSSTASNNRREVDDVSFEYCGSTSADSLKLFIAGASTQSTPFLSFDSNSFYQGANTTLMFISVQNFGSFAFSNLAFFSNTGGGPGIYTASGTSFNIEDSVFYAWNGSSQQSSFSQGGQGCNYTRVKFWSSGSYPVSHTNGDGETYTDCSFHSAATNGLVFIGAGSTEFITCKFGSSDLPGTPTFPYVHSSSGNPGQVHSSIMTDCSFGTPTTSFSNLTNLAIANSKYKLIVANKNLDPSQQEIYTPSGIIYRDNTSKISGVTSLKLSPVSASNPLTFTLDIPAPNGNLVGVSGKLWRDTANTATVTLSGLGITPSVYTASGSLSADETFSVQGTNTSGTDGFLTLTISVTGASGNMWVDAVSAPQAAAIDFGEFGYWARGLPASVVAASFVSAGDVWNYLSANISTTGSIGVFVKKLLTVAKFLGLK